MSNMLQKAWAGMLRPLLRRPERFQVAALCHRQGPEGLEILLITSRDTGRSVLPKGWPIAGLDARDSAVQEAWEEAGVIPGTIGREPIGTYGYDKRLRGGVPVPCETTVFPVAVKALAEEYPEAAERSREWVTPEVAAQRVQEPRLKELLRNLPPRLPA